MRFVFIGSSGDAEGGRSGRERQDVWAVCCSGHGLNYRSRDEAFGPGGVFIHSLQKKHFKHDHCCLQSFPERTAPALWVLKPGGLAPEPGD